MKIYQGAEAIVSRKGQEVVKDRISKGYRIPEIDSKLRKQRTRMEARIMAKARRFGLDIPRILETEDSKIRMEFIDGLRLKDCLESLPTEERKAAYKKIGSVVANLHSAGMIHGDLTTSNMILKDEKLFLIDFGLAKSSTKLEDQAIDLFLLYEAIQASHFSILEEAWNTLIKTYEKDFANSKEVLKQIEAIRKRRRYK